MDKSVESTKHGLRQILVKTKNKNFQNKNHWISSYKIAKEFFYCNLQLKNHIRNRCPSTQDTVLRQFQGLADNAPESSFLGVKHINCLKVLTKELSEPCSLAWQKTDYGLIGPVTRCQNLH